MAVSDNHTIARGWRAVTFAVLAILTAGCVAGPRGREAVADVPVAVHAPRGFAFHGPLLLADHKGLRAHGSLCRTLVGPLWPGQVSLELLNPDGTSAARAYGALTDAARAPGLACTVYNLPTAWRPLAGQSLRLTAD